MISSSRICRTCGQERVRSAGGCLLCSGAWQIWELRHPALPLEDISGKFSEWVGHLPHPSAFVLRGDSAGLRILLIAPQGGLMGSVQAWSALTRGSSTWVKRPGTPAPGTPLFALHSPSLLPVLPLSSSDTTVSLGGAMLNMVSQTGRSADLIFWILGREDKLQDRLRALTSYATGTERGVDDDTPNPWALRLGLWRGLMLAGSFVAAGAGASLAPGWINPLTAWIGITAGATLALGGFMGTLNWMRLRSLSRQILEPRLEGPLLRTAISLAAGDPGGLRPLAGGQQWRRLRSHWPDVRRYAFPLPAEHLARVIAPVEGSDLVSILAPDSVQPVPHPEPARAYIEAPVRIGRDPGTGREIGIGTSGHALVVGGSRTGKSSAIYWMLRRMVAEPESAPGIFVVDPHGSLADGLLDAIDRLPDSVREQALQRLRIVTPSEKYVIPLNLLTVPDFSWAGNALVQAGVRIWGDFWGPRMQAALLALARLGHAWNRQHPDRPLGLIHTVFAAHSQAWRAEMAGHLPPESRMGASAFDAMLGQAGGRGGPRNRQWVTEVISPILSKMMSLELSPWLFSALHQSSFVDLGSWIAERCWVIVRLPAGEIGREGARLTAGMVYNMFEAAFRQATSSMPVRFTFVVDETQEIAQAMRLESLLSEGGKFGARMIVLAQSLSMLRAMDGFEPVVQSLLANTSSQLFFSPDPEDADLIRRTLSITERYGPSTLDVPSLQAWLRARLAGRWHPPALVEIEPMLPADPNRVRRLIREVADAHPGIYLRREDANFDFPEGLPTFPSGKGDLGEREGKPDPYRLGL